MAIVREFDPVTNDEIQCAVGALSDFTFGTYVILVERMVEGAGHTIVAPHTSGGTGAGLRVGHTEFNDTSLVAGDGAPSNVGSVGTANIYRVYVWRKGTGSLTPRLSTFNKSTATWSHGNGHAAIGDGTAPSSTGTIRFNIGQFTGRGHYRIAAIAAWKTVKWAADTTGDDQIVAAGLETAYQNWIDNVPDAAWKFNQAATTTAVVDDTGNGADETAITGTTVVDDPDLTFDYSLSSGGLVVEVPFLSDPSTLFNPSITVGAVSVEVPLLSDPELLFQPEVSTAITVPLLSVPSTLYHPEIVVGAVTIEMQLLRVPSSVYSPGASGGIAPSPSPGIGSEYWFELFLEEF